MARDNQAPRSGVLKSRTGKFSIGWESGLTG